MAAVLVFGLLLFVQGTSVHFIMYICMVQTRLLTLSLVKPGIRTWLILMMHPLSHVIL